MQLLRDIREIEFTGGTTNLYAGLRGVRLRQFDPDLYRDSEQDGGDHVPKVLIYITDGRNTAGDGTTLI